MGAGPGGPFPHFSPDRLAPLPIRRLAHLLEARGDLVSSPGAHVAPQMWARGRLLSPPPPPALGRVCRYHVCHRVGAGMSREREQPQTRPNAKAESLGHVRLHQGTFRSGSRVPSLSCSQYPSQDVEHLFASPRKPPCPPYQSVRTPHNHGSDLTHRRLILSVL